MKISSMTAGTTLDGTEKFEAVQSGGTVSVTAAQLAELAKEPVVTTTVTSGTITPAGDTDLLRPDALTAALTIADPSSTPADGAGFVIDVIDAGVSRTLTWGSKYADRMATLPTATIPGKRHRIGVEYSAADDKLYCMYAEVEA